MSVAAYILSGGESKRMGVEKGLVSYKNKPMIQWVIEAVQPITEDIVIVTNSEKYEHLGYRTIADEKKKKGPLGGIATALNHSTQGLNLILSCDIPEIRTATLKKLLENSKTQVTICKQNNRLHPLVGSYHKSCLHTIHEQLDTNQLAVMSALDKLDLKILDMDIGYDHDFKNINSPEELQ